MKALPRTLALVGFALLLGACGQNAAEKPVPIESDLPAIPIAQRPAQPDCGQNVVAQAGGIRNFRFENHFAPSKVRAQGTAELADTVQGELISARSSLNSYYYGFSSVDRAALNTKYEALFRKDRPGNLASYGLNDQTDQLMDQYIGDMNDPHTYFLNADIYQFIKDVIQGNAQPAPSFGFFFRPVPNADGAVLVDVRGDSPAFAAGLRRGDVIVSIDGQPLRRSGDDEATFAAYAKLRAAAAAKKQPVPIAYRRAGGAQTINLTGAVLSAAELPWGEVRTDAAGQKQFYLRLPTFEPVGAAQRVHDLVAQAKAAGVRGVIVDLRDNGGGLITEYLASAGAFAPATTGNILENLSADDATAKYAGNGNLSVSSVCEKTVQTIPYVQNAQEWTGNVAVLVNGNSASGSEYFSQALRLGGKASILGEKTYGAGNTFTNFFDLPGGRAMTVTLGRSRQLNGAYNPEDILPDNVQPDDLAKLAAGNDLALNAAFAYLDK